MAKAANKKPDADRYHNLRFERKFIYEDIELEDLIQTVVFTNPFCFKEIFHRRTVNNIYFDDSRMEYYHQNVAGDMEREKYRLRWYGDTFSEIKRPTLEVKKKFGEVGDKVSFKLKKLECSLKNLNGEQAKREVEAYLIKKGHFHPATQLAVLSATLYNSYERRYFLSHCGRFRITLDYNMQFYDPLAKNPNQPIRKLNEIVLELKYETRFDARARDVAQHFNTRLSKNSKYVRGVDYLYT